MPEQISVCVQLRGRSTCIMQDNEIFQTGEMPLIRLLNCCGAESWPGLYEALPGHALNKTSGIRFSEAPASEHVKRWRGDGPSPGRINVMSTALPGLVVVSEPRVPLCSALLCPALLGSADVSALA